MMTTVAVKTQIISCKSYKPNMSVLTNIMKYMTSANICNSEGKLCNQFYFYIQAHKGEGGNYKTKTNIICILCTAKWQITSF